MAGPRTSRNPGCSEVRIREVEHASAPFHVSDGITPQSASTPKPSRNFQRSPQPHAVLVDRPSTSAGVSTRKTNEKHRTRDDLHVNPLRDTQIGTTYYNFPLPSSLHARAASPRTSSSRSYTPEVPGPELIVSDYSHKHLEIGMALGSPTHQTTIWSEPLQRQAPGGTYSPESLEEWQKSARLLKRKPSKWKKWGGIFGRKSSDSSLESSRSYREAHTVTETDYTTFPDPPTDRPRGRAQADSEWKINKHKPNIQRTNTVPMGFQFQGAESPPKGPKEFPVLAEARPPEIKLEGGPLLNVDIPTIEMERYSVMFGSVIKPSTSASSLLARRQATLDRLKTVNEEIAQHERQEAEKRMRLMRPRRATSPQPTNSPTMSLFPAPPRTQRTQRNGSGYPPYRASPLHRSNTSPAALSPNRQTFEPLRPHEEEHTIMLAATPTSEPAATLTSPWSADESFLVMDSPNSMASVQIYDRAPLKPNLIEPKWEMISRRTIPDDVMKVKPLRIAPKPDPQLQQLPRKKSLKSSLDALARVGAKSEAEELIRTAADVSIARQISISRRQRQLLVPIKSRVSNSGPTATITENASEGLLVNEKQAMMPKLVNVQARRVVRSEVAVFDRA